MATYQVRSLKEADQIIKEHERKTKTVYAPLKSTKNFSCIDLPACANDENEVRFETVGVPYCGVPFFVAGLKILQCQSYRGRGNRKKKVLESNQNNGEDGAVVVETNIAEESQRKSNKKKVSRLHKAGCTATIIMKEIIYYPEFQLHEHSKNNRIAVARQLKDNLRAKAPVQKDRIIYVTVPAASDHSGHSVGISVQKGGSKRLYVKNDFYGHNEPGTSKKVYYPVKQERLTAGHINKKLKMEDDSDDVEMKAQQVREILQSIMALTYKQPGTVEMLHQLLKDLIYARQCYLKSMDIIDESACTITEAKDGPTKMTGPWPDTGHSNETSVSATSTSSLTETTDSVPVVTVQSASSTESNSQETSIFIEAMEAIFNSQM